jgi:hypothetical protein
VPATQVDISGTAVASFLQPGLLVHLRADIDGKTMTARQPVSELKIVTVSEQYKPSVVADGGAATAPAGAKKGTVEGPCTITLQVKQFKNGKLSLAYGKKKIDVEVPDDAKIEVAATHPQFLAVARKGDEVQASGYYLKEGDLIASSITVKLTTPLSAPAGKSSTAKVAKPAQPKAPAADEPAAEKPANGAKVDDTKTESTDEKAGAGKKPAGEE